MTHTFPTRRSSDLPAGPCRQPGFHRIGLLVSGDADARKVDGRLDHGSRQAVAAPHHAAAQGCGDQAGQGGRAVAVNGQRNREARRPSGLTRAPPITDEEIPMRMTPVTTLRKTALLPALIATGLFAGCGGAAESAADAARSEEHTSELQSLMRTSYA